jgi:hypothetical protein
MINFEFSAWVNQSVRKLHLEQIEHEKKNAFKYSIAEPMGVLLQNEAMKDVWKKLLKELIKQGSEHATHVHVYSIIASGIASANQLTSSEQWFRIRMSKEEKDDFIKDNMNKLEQVKRNLKKIGYTRIPRMRGDAEDYTRSALDTFDRFGVISDTKNLESDIHIYAFANHFMRQFPTNHKTQNGKYRLVLMEEVAIIVSVLFDRRCDAKAATKAYKKAEKAFTLKPAQWAMQRWPQYDQKRKN